MPKLEGFLKAIDKAERDKARIMTICFRASQADEKNFKKFVKGFEDE